MENIDKGTNTSEWVRDQLAGLAPAETWQPDVEDGFAHLQRYEHMAKRRLHLQRIAVVLVFVACVVVLALPTTRGIARQLLDRFYTMSPEAVRSLVPETGKPAK